MYHACEAVGSGLTRVKTEDEKSKRDPYCLALGKSRPFATEKTLFQKPLFFSSFLGDARKAFARCVAGLSTSCGQK